MRYSYDITPRGHELGGGWKATGPSLKNRFRPKADRQLSER